MHNSPSAYCPHEIYTASCQQGAFHRDVVDSCARYDFGDVCDPSTALQRCCPGFVRNKHVAPPHLHLKGHLTATARCISSQLPASLGYQGSSLAISLTTPGQVFGFRFSPKPPADLLAALSSPSELFDRFYCPEVPGSAR